MKIIKYASIGFLLGFLLSLITFKASAQDQKYSRNYNVNNFSEIYLEGAYKVYLKQGEEPALKVSAPNEEVFDYYDISSDQSELHVTMKDRYIHFTKLTLYITVKNLDKIHIEGGVKLGTSGYIHVNDLDVHVEGGANIEMRVKGGALSATGEGGVLFRFIGTADNLVAKLSGAGHLDAGELKTKNVTVKIEGVGTGSVYATDELWTEIDGLGKISYRGDPQVHRTIEGIGAVSHD